MNAVKLDVPYYRPVGDECTLFSHAYQERLALLLKGPTGCGKSRFVEHMAQRLGRPLITVAANDDTSAVDLLGRYLVHGGDTVWVDGPVTRAVREGAILYIDEVAEARPDVVVVLHALTDHRRTLSLDRTNETVVAPAEFMMVVSYNPGYQGMLKELKPSTRQRFVALAFDYPAPEIEVEILRGETGIEEREARLLVALAGRLRTLKDLGLTERPSTRLLIGTARLMNGGIPPRIACQAALVEPLTDDRELVSGLMEVVHLVF